MDCDGRLSVWSFNSSSDKSSLRSHCMITGVSESRGSGAWVGMLRETPAPTFASLQLILRKPNNRFKTCQISPLFSKTFQGLPNPLCSNSLPPAPLQLYFSLYLLHLLRSRPTASLLTPEHARLATSMKPLHLFFLLLRTPFPPFPCDSHFKFLLKCYFLNKVYSYQPM